jgi:tetratricopeptide (TPR) repeat protein
MVDQDLDINRRCDEVRRLVSDKEFDRALNVVAPLRRFGAAPGGAGIVAETIAGALPTLQAEGAPLGMWRAILGSSLRHLGRVVEAAEQLELARGLIDAQTAPEQWMYTVSELADALRSSGGEVVNRAKAIYEEGLATALKRRDKRYQARFLAGAGGCDLLLGNAHGAIKLLRAAMEADSRLTSQGVFLSNLGACFIELEDWPAALEYLKKAETIYKQASDQRGLALCLGNLGMCFKGLGDTDQSAQYLERAIELDRAHEDVDGESADLINLGFALEQSEPLRARVCLEKARDLCLRAGLLDRVPMIDHTLREISARMEDGSAKSAGV